jgi:acetolactate synthase I/II/III large subunit
MYRIADFIKEYFLSKSIDTCFCVTGGGAMHINDSYGHDPRITTIYNHHEQASAIAAEGYARVSGKPAIVSVTSGPGATNAITGVVGSWLDSIPMVILSGQMKRETLITSTDLPLRQLGFQEFNIVDAVKCMTKFCKVLSETFSMILKKLTIS